METATRNREPITITRNGAGIVVIRDTLRNPFTGVELTSPSSDVRFTA